MRLLCLLLAVLCAVAACAAADKPAPDPENPLARQTYEILRGRCWGCHGEPGKKAYGETGVVDWILDYDKLIEYGLVEPGSPRRSRLVYMTAVEGKMPRAFDENGIPSIEDSLSDEEIQTLIDWVKAGAPRWRVAR